ncbi:ABC transporter permease [Xanthocytophaga agilis]|uniref:ABC transporter permease n=1 Tax=Xanthocytophaga agilis TaxID=3048010 RepID=A0AAE3UBY6_9BACT|nr:ABC transporter permease [Xanthocytophaga agilis]MDJ1499545.1 ABC transporter permease [Xanthocytophaga agilis]
MLTNYLKIAFRNIWRNKLYAIITVLGLSIGITCVLLAVLYIQDERHFDNFHTKKSQLYRITTSIIQEKGDQTQITGGTGQVQGPAFKTQVPEVNSYVRVMGGDISADVRANDKVLKLHPLYVDANFLDVFTFKLLQGNPQTVLQNANSVVITEETAFRFFNTTDVIGQTLYLDADPSFQKIGKPLLITGVIQNPPYNSSFQFDLLHPFQYMQVSFEDTSWLNAYLSTFVVLHPNADLSTVSQKFNKIHARLSQSELATNHTQYPKIQYGLQNILDIHLNPLNNGTGNVEGGILYGSKPIYSYLFLGISALILLMASSNFVNISIANSLKRAKEVGIRKVTGGSQYQIIFQFLGESMLLSLVAFVLSALWIQLTLPAFNQLAEKHLVLSDTLDSQLYIYIGLLFLINTLLTGFYPAFVLSGFKPVEVLYRKVKVTGNSLLGRTLIVFQFALAIFLLIASIIFYNQMEYIQTKDLGYNPHQIIRTHINGNREYQTVQTILRNEIAKVPAIQQISFGEEFSSLTTDIRVGSEIIKSHYQSIDEAYIPMLGIKIKEGRNFTNSFPTDKTQNIIVNEAFVKAARLKQPIGTILQNFERRQGSLVIVGVVQNYHSGSLREKLQPMVLFMSNEYTGGIWLKIDKLKQQEALQAFEKIYKQAMPDASYEYHFLSELNAKEYIQEQRWQQIIGIATILSILICCSGLFGLAHLSAHQRIKEIGIRKVLGASISHIVFLVSSSFLQLVLLGFVIATPVAWFVMHQWLRDFAYHISIQGWMFLLTGSFISLIALLTVGYQAIRAALKNPTESLKVE